MVLDSFQARKLILLPFPIELCNLRMNSLEQLSEAYLILIGCVFIDKRKSYKLYYPRIALQTVSKDLYNQLVSYLSRHFSLYNTFNEKDKFI